MSIASTNVSVSSISDLFTIPPKTNLKFSLLYNFAAGIPTAGAISLNSFKGKSPATVSGSAVPSQNGNTYSAAISFSLNLSNYASTDSYGTPLSFTKISDATGTTSSISGSTLSINAAFQAKANGTTTYTAKNRFNKSVTISIPLKIISALPYSLSQPTSVNGLYNIRDKIVAAGWNQTTPVEVTYTIQSGVIKGGGSSGYAIDTGSPYPAGSFIIIVNNGTISGRGGAGANTAGTPGNGTGAILARYDLNIVNNGTIQGGGGGGKGGATRDTGLVGGTGNTYYGGGGGGGAGYPGGAGSEGGEVVTYDANYYGYVSNTTYRNISRSGTLTSGGAGGTGYPGQPSGGNGGNPGLPGVGPGGNAGLAVGYYYNVPVTFTVTGTINGGIAQTA